MVDKVVSGLSEPERNRIHGAVRGGYAAFWPDGGRFAPDVPIVFEWWRVRPAPVTLVITIGEEQTEVDEMVLDAVSEFTNVVVGNGCTKLSMQDIKVIPEPPKVMTREMIDQMVPEDIVKVSLETAKGNFGMIFFFWDVKQ